MRTLSPPPWLETGRVPCLDGLRGLAIGLVVFSHALGTDGFPLARDHRLWEPLNLVGPLGVSIFFVLSGFLITLLMLREHRQTSAISVRGFYVRRALRILPAYVAYLAVLAIAKATAGPHDWTLALTYTASILPPKGWAFIHLWSLSIEEQFYLVWPLLMVVFGAKRAMIAAVSCIAVTLAGRLVVLLAFSEYVWWMDYFTPTRLDCIAIGCLLALATTNVVFMRASVALGPWLRRLGPVAIGLLAIWFVLSTPPLASLVLGALDLGRIPAGAALLIEVIKNLLVGVFVATVIWSAANSPDWWLGRLLEWRPLAILGVMSYSVYLWQQFFLNWDEHVWIYRWPVNMLFVVLAAGLSYKVVEQPFLRLKARPESS